MVSSVSLVQFQSEKRLTPHQVSSEELGCFVACVMAAHCSACSCWSFELPCDAEHDEGPPHLVTPYQLLPQDRWGCLVRRRQSVKTRANP